MGGVGGGPWDPSAWSSVGVWRRTGLVSGLVGLQQEGLQLVARLS